MSKEDERELSGRRLRGPLIRDRPASTGSHAVSGVFASPMQSAGLAELGAVAPEVESDENCRVERRRRGASLECSVRR